MTLQIHNGVMPTDGTDIESRHTVQRATWIVGHHLSEKAYCSLNIVASANADVRYFFNIF